MGCTVGRWSVGLWKEKCNFSAAAIVADFDVSRFVAFVEVVVVKEYYSLF